MFTTNESGRSPLLKALYEPNEHCWNFVSLEIWIPWYLVTLEIDYGEEGRFAETLFLHSLRYIEQLASSTNQTIISVQLVKPHKDSRRRWQLEDVISINEVTSDDSATLIALNLASGEVFIGDTYDILEKSEMTFAHKSKIWPT